MLGFETLGEVTLGEIKATTAAPAATVAWWEALGQQRHRRRVLSQDIVSLPPQPIVAAAAGYIPEVAWVDRPSSRLRQGADTQVVSPVRGGYLAWVTGPERATLRRPSRSDVVVTGVLATAARPAWIVIPEVRPRRSQRVSVTDLPVQRVPTKFVPNAWVSLWDGPPRKPFRPALQRADQPVLAIYASVIVTYPDGWQAIFPQLGKFTKPQGSAEISYQPAIMPQGWGAVLADQRAPRRQPMAQETLIQPAATVISGWAVLADLAVIKPRAVGTEAFGQQQIVAVTYQAWGFIDRAARQSRAASGSTVDALAPTAAAATSAWGWEVRADIVRRRATQDATAGSMILPAAIYRPWGFTDQTIRRPAVDRSATVSLSAPVLATPQGFGVTFQEPIRVHIRVPGWETLALGRVGSSVAGFSGFSELPPARRRKPLGDVTNGAVTVSAVGLQRAIWGFVDYHFRTIRPATTDFARLIIRTGVRIVSRPTLLGTDQRPTMDGTDAQASLLGTDAQAGLDGAKAAPTLLGTKAKPDLEGDI